MTGPCYSFPTIPQLLVCPACFQSTVVPSIDGGSQVALQFDRNPKPSSAFYCELASPRMKNNWQQAIVRNDVAYLRDTVDRRAAKRKEVESKLGALQVQKKMRQNEQNYYMQLASLEMTSHASTLATSMNLAGFRPYLVDMRVSFIPFCSSVTTGTCAESSEERNGDPSV
jgi:hypothetical protein